MHTPRAIRGTLVQFSGRRVKPLRRCNPLHSFVGTWHRTPHECRFCSRLIVSSAALLTPLILVSRETLLQARLLSVALSATTFSMVLVQLLSGGVAIFRWFLACLQASFPVLLTLLLPLRRRAVVTTCLRKVKHRITAPLRVSSSSLLWL